MNLDQTTPTQLIWATRGRTWGFRFLWDGGLPDPLPEYERIFAEITDEPIAWRKERRCVALRFPDPLGRRDASGRLIPHEFVVFGAAADAIDSLEHGQEQVWTLVADIYTRVWDADTLPSPADLVPDPAHDSSTRATDSDAGTA